ncbi:MAG: hypothetical protein JW720_01190 [Sedimentisphaerales bacterium]|nr:hypothetical protein [Sedimentisphaerales bacterium]
MKRPEDNDRLDEALADAIGSDRPTRDFDEWKERYPQAVEMLTSRAKAASQASGRPPMKWSTMMRNRNIRYSAAAAAIIVAAIIGLTPFPGGSLTFAEAVEPILSAQTIAFDLVLGTDEASPAIHEVVAGSRIRRTISNIPGMVMILDLENQKMLALDTVRKTAGYVELGEVGHKTENYIEGVRRMARELKGRSDIEKLDGQEIDGEKVVRFTGGNEREKVVVWVSTKTRLPVRVELQLGQMPVVFKNFEFDVDLPDSDISMEIPEGYTKDAVQFDLSNAAEQDLVDSLRIWAEIVRDGTFPETIGTEQYMKSVAVLGGKIPQLDMPDSEKEQLGFKFGKGMIFLQKFEMGGKWGYAGKGVRLGDGGKVILWYQPEGAKAYRAIYGDLRAADVAEEDLPK